MKRDAKSKMLPIIVGFHRQEAIPRQGKSAKQLKSWRRSTRESQWEGTSRVGLRSISDELSIEKPPDSTSTSYLVAKGEMGDAPASIGRRSWCSHLQPLPGCWATSCGFRRNNPVPNPAPTSSSSNMPIGIRSWTTDGAGKMAQHP